MFNLLLGNMIIDILLKFYRSVFFNPKNNQDGMDKLFY